LSYLLCFTVSFALYGLSFALSLRRERRPRWLLHIALLPAVLFNGATLFVMVCRAGHLPSHFLFERFVELALGAGLLLWILSLVADTRRISSYVLGMILCLFTVALAFPKELSPPIFRFSLFTAQLFFQLEALAFVLLLFSAAYYLLCLVEKGRLPDERSYMQKGRRYLLMGFTVFLTSQFFGSIWSLQGWGDYWMWGKMSSMGVVVWFYLMLVIHMRYAHGFGRVFEAGVGSSLFLLLLVYRMAWQP
jgi:hypothetical protein